VIASERGSLPEVIGEGGLVFDAEDHLAIASAIAQILCTGDHLARLREAALARAAHFSWARTARHTLEIYDEAFQRWEHAATRRGIRSIGDGDRTVNPTS
jgi:glycosyltransferase involved in cell wall biosynthesis